jgi:NAD+ kinase
MDAAQRRFAAIHFTASLRPKAQQALRAMKARYGDTPAAEADVVVALGGDGFMLETLHAFMGRDMPIYGMNCGSVGFLMNEYEEDGLLDRLDRAETAIIRPLQAKGRDVRNRPFSALAINEVSLLRELRQTAKLKISIDGKERLPELVADGVLVATPAGSTAYNLSAHGPILPITARLLALTPISPFRPRSWRGALLPHHAKVRIEVLEPEKRPVAAVADNQEFRDIAYIDIQEHADLVLKMLYDEGRALEERILAEQFAH